MPTYEYRCESTNTIYEVDQGINDLPYKMCMKPNCSCNGTSPTHRIISKNIGLIFNGSGFYQTDYARKKEEKPPPTNIPPCQTCSEAGCPNAQK